MKLAKLKDKFKHKYQIRIVAGVLIIAVLGSTAGYALHGSNVKGNSVESTEQSQNTKDQNNDESGTNGNTESKENAESDENALSKEKTEIGKDETVYIVADQNGTQKDIIVSEWLKNPKKLSVLKDCSDLKEIENVKGDETFDQEGNVLSWKAEGSDIYYQGRTSKKTPVSETITYYLDGKEISADKLAGKSGSVKIRIDYTNHEKNGEVFVPFTAVTGMVLNDNFSNVQVTNGKDISNGDGTIVIGMAMPGLKESLNIKESDFSEDISIPDYVEVTADVEKFELDMTMTVIMSAADLVQDTSFDLSDLDEKINDLTSAMEQLEDGSGELADGLDTLDQKMGEFSDGTDTLQNGIAAYTDGAKTLADRIETLNSQTGLLTDGLGTISSSVGTLNNGIQSLDQALNTVMGEKEKSKVTSAAKSAAENAVEAQFADDSNPQSYNNIKAQAAQVFYDSVTSQEVQESAAAAAKRSAAAGIKELEPAIAAQAKAQAEAAINGQMDQIAAQAKAQAVAAASGAVSPEMQAQLQAAFTAAGYVQAAETNGITVEDAMSNPTIQASVAQAAGRQMQVLTETIGAAAGTVAEETAKSVASNVAAGVAEQVAPEVAEQVASSVAEQVAPGVVVSVAEQAKESVGTSLADSVKQGAKTAAGTAAGQAAVQGAETAKQQIAESIEKKDAESGYSLVSGMNELANGVFGAADKVPMLKDGVYQLYAGSQTLASKNGELNDGASKLKDGTDRIVEGVQKLKDGSEELADGISKFDEEGIKKLVDSYNGDVKELTDRMQAVLDSGNAYQSFGGKPEGVAGRVKFIVKTDGIRAE